jgi:hypothetical protein
MVYDTRDYWVFGLCMSSGILKNTKEHNVLETEPLEYVSYPPHLRMERDPVTETSCSLEYRRRKSPKPQQSQQSYLSIALFSDKNPKFETPILTIIYQNIKTTVFFNGSSSQFRALASYSVP